MTRSILLVDDSETVLMLERISLQGLGCRLRVARNGNQALREVEKEQPDLILLDLCMPELDGVETCRKLKGDPATQGIPIVIVTTKGEPERVGQAFEAGCDDYITKPVDPMELMSKVKIYLGRIQS